MKWSILQKFWVNLLPKKFYEIEPDYTSILCLLDAFCNAIGLYHPLGGITNPKYKLFVSLNNYILQREDGTSF
jgi:hypothetical protein